MSLELYINNTFVELGEKTKIGLTLQANDIADIQNKKANYTNQFKVPKTNSNNFLFGFCGNVSSDTNFPYQKATAKIIQDGIELVQNGYAIIDEADEAFSITVYSGNADLFELIKDKKLTDLDLSEYDHTWNLTNINDNVINQTNEDGYIYSIINYGLLGTFSAAEMYWIPPAIRCKKIVQKIIEGAGFNIAGGIYDNSDSILNKMVIPYCRNEQQLDNPGLTLQMFSAGAAYLAKSGFNSYSGSANSIGFYTAPVLNTIFNNEAGAYFDNNNRHLNGVYTSDVSAFQKFTANIDIDAFITAPLGAVSRSGYLSITVKFRGLVDGTIVSISSGALSLPAIGATASLNFLAETEMYLIKKYGTVDMEVELFTSVVHYDVGGNMIFTGSRTDGELLTTSYWFNTMDGNLVYGEPLFMNALLPDMTQADFLKSILQFTCGQIQTDAANGIVYLEFFEKLKDNLPSKKDWSLKFTSGVDAVKFRAPYAQTNYLKYKKDDSNTVDANTWDGSFSINDNTLDVEKTIVQSLFSGTETSGPHDVGNVDVYAPYINKQDLTTGFFTNKTEPRILLYERETLSNTVRYLGDTLVDGATYDFFSAICFTTWFVDTHNVRDNHLAFNNSLIADHYQTLINLLVKYKQVTAEVNLSSIDIGNYFDHLIPIYCEKHAADFYCYLIENYKSGQLTKVNLIRL